MSTISLTLLNMLFGGTAILILAWTANVCLRRNTASLRHRVWTLAVVGLLLTPGLAVVMPRIPISPKRERGVIELPTRMESPRADAWGWYETERVSDESLPAATTSNVPGLVNPSHAEQRSAAKIPWESIFVGVWLGGVVLGFVSLFLGKISARNIAENSIPADESWEELGKSTAKKIGIRFRVGIRRTDAVAVPMVVGILKPTVLLPSEAATWTEPQRRSVLIHELSHVLRRDVFWQTLAGLCTAIYWFHPLVHVAVRKMRIEQESACDDAVLFAGETPSDYARLLVDIAGRVLRRTPVHAVAMARPGSVQERVDAILETKRNRKPLGRFAAWELFVAATVVVSAVFLFSPFAPPPILKAEPLKTEHPTESVEIHGAIKIGGPDGTALPIYINMPTDRLPADLAKQVGKASDATAETAGERITVVNGKKYVVPKGKTVVVDFDTVSRTNVVKFVDIAKVFVEPDPDKPKRIRVLDNQGNPLENVSVRIRLGALLFPRVEKETDKNGELHFCYAKSEPPNSLFVVEVLPNAEQHFVPMYQYWRRTGIVDEIPNEIVFRLPKSKTVEGTVVDREGRPIAGADVQMVLSRETEFNKAAVLRQLDQMTTDHNGHWKSNHAPADEPSVQVIVTHPNYVDKKEPILLQKDSPPHRAVLKRLVRVEGIVVDENGKPVPNVDVSTSYIGQPGGSWSGKTDADGKFVIEKYPPSNIDRDIQGATSPTIQLFAPDHVRIHQRFFVQEGMKPLRLVMPKGKTLRIRVVDTNKNPLQGINIAANYVLEKAGEFSYERFDSRQPLIGPVNNSEEKTNADGLWECRNAPDREIRFRFGDRIERYLLGGDYLTKYVMLKPSDEIQEIVLDRPRMLTGSVIDAKSREPIPSFTLRDGENRITKVVLPRYGTDFKKILSEIRQVFGATQLKENTPYMLEAEGYEPKPIVFKVKDDTVKLDVELEPLEK